MCGIVGVFGIPYANEEIYNALTLLQHRGQDAAGIMTSNGKSLFLRKSTGLVREVLQSRHMLRLQGSMGIGHVRYPTAGSAGEAEAQPLYVNSPYGIALAHNGNLVNVDALKTVICQVDLRHLNTDSDSELILNVLATELQRTNRDPLTPSHVFQAVQGIYQRCSGAYAVVALINGQGLLAFRDPYGIRPLCYGSKVTPQGIAYMVASESVALSALGYELCGDIKPGEAIFITMEGKLFRQICVSLAHYSPCIFEYVYLARPDSLIDEISVYQARLRLGEYLAQKIQREWAYPIDVVMPVPDTSRVAAYALALCLGKSYREGLVKNHYIGRTFIMPGQQKRKHSVRQKLNAIDVEFRDKHVLLVDDSIVRGTTSCEIIQMVREAGAKKVYFASAAPEIRFPNVYGIDMPAASELIAHARSTQEICHAIGADGLIFQNLKDLIAAVREGNPKITRFEDSVFTGDYVTGNISEAYLQTLSAKRNDAMRARELALNQEIQTDWYNDNY